MTSNVFVARGRPAHRQSTAWLQRVSDSHSLANYEFESELDGGAFGRVFDVQTMSTSPPHRCCVLKVTPRSPLRRSADERERARAECATLARLAERTPPHVNVALPLEVWTEPDGRACMLFEKRPLDLFDFLKSRRWRGLSIKHAGDVLAQVCSALRCLHTEFNLVHNDIKAENVLIDPASMHCWLTDFGGACSPSNAIDYDNRTKTRYFASPERRHALPFDTRSDSWGVGMLAIELIKGGLIMDEWISDQRWNELMAQVTQSADSALWIEPLEEPGFLDYVASPMRCARNASFAAYRGLLFKTIRMNPDNRATPAELLASDSVARAFLRPSAKRKRR